jgi:hypothetical protein
MKGITCAKVQKCVEGVAGRKGHLKVLLFPLGSREP